VDDGGRMRGVRGGVRGVRVNQASPRDERAWEAIVLLEQGLDYILKRIIDMTATQSEFDQAFTNLSEGVQTLIADFRELNAKIQSLPSDGGTPAQLQEVKDLSAKVHAALPAEAPVSPPASVSPVVDAPPPTPPTTPPTTPPVAAPVAAPVTPPVTPPADAPGTVTPQAL